MDSGQTGQGLVDHSEDFGLFPENNGEAWKGF